MYKHVKTGCKHIPPSEQPLQLQSGYFFNKPRMYSAWISEQSAIISLHSRDYFYNWGKKCSLFGTN